MSDLVERLNEYAGDWRMRAASNELVLVAASEIDRLRRDVASVLEEAIEWRDRLTEEKANSALLTLACKGALGHLTGNMDGDMDLGDPIEMLRSAVAKTEGRQ